MSCIRSPSPPIPPPEVPETLYRKTAQRLKSLLSPKRSLQPSGPAPPVPIIIADILPVIFSYLSRADLTRCLRVNYLYYQAAGKALYGSLEGVEYGEIPLPPSGLLKLRRTRDMSPFVGLEVPRIPVRPSFIRIDTKPPITGRSGQPPPPSIIRHRQLLEPPHSKLALLNHIRHLTCHMKLRSHEDYICSLQPAHYLPKLHTITYCFRSYDRKNHFFAGFYEPDFQAGGHPHHVRFTNLPSLESPFRSNVPLGLGSAIERITLQMIQPPRARLEPHPSIDRYCCQPRPRKTPQIVWPVNMRYLDIIFTRPVCLRGPKDPSSIQWEERGPIAVCDFVNRQWDHDTCPHDYYKKVPLVEVEHLAAVASHCPGTLRVVGLCTDEDFLVPRREWGEIGAGTGVWGWLEQKDKLEAGFPARLREAFKEASVRGGMGQGMALRRAEEMEILSLEQYWAEKGSMPF